MTRAEQVLPFTLPDLPEAADHAIAGKAIVPAVELLDLVVHKVEPAEAALPLVMRDAAFPRFLSAEEVRRCEFTLALEEADADHGIRASLASRIPLASGMYRTRVHLAVTLGGAAPAAPEPPQSTACELEVAAERVYSDVVRFGPRFRNLRGSLRLGPDGAVGTVASPSPPHPHPSRAGCPFLLDSAMHLACLWGQRYAGYVAYPTGFSSRIITAPLACGQRRCHVVPRKVEARRLDCDLWLHDDAGRVCDVILGLAMAPLRTGAPPPSWIVHPQAAFRTP